MLFLLVSLLLLQSRDALMSKTFLYFSAEKSTSAAFAENNPPPPHGKRSSNSSSSDPSPSPWALPSAAAAETAPPGRSGRSAWRLTALGRRRTQRHSHRSSSSPCTGRPGSSSKRRAAPPSSARTASSSRLCYSSNNSSRKRCCNNNSSSKRCNNNSSKRCCNSNSSSSIKRKSQLRHRPRPCLPEMTSLHNMRFVLLFIVFISTAFFSFQTHYRFRSIRDFITYLASRKGREDRKMEIQLRWPEPTHREHHSK